MGTDVIREAELRASLNFLVDEYALNRHRQHAEEQKGLPP